MIFAVSIVRFLGSLPGKDTSRGLYVPERVFYIDYKYIYNIFNVYYRYEDLFSDKPCR